MKIISAPGRYSLISSGETKTCGVYVVSGAEQLVQIEVEAVDVTCGEGLLVVSKNRTGFSKHLQRQTTINYAPPIYIRLSIKSGRRMLLVISYVLDFD